MLAPRSGKRFAAAVLGAALLPMLAVAPGSAATSPTATDSERSPGGPSFGKCDKHYIGTPHRSNRGRGVVAKAQAVCPTKYTTEISLKLFRCKKKPRAKLGWLFKHCKSKLRWNNARRDKAGGKHWRKPVYVPRGPKGSGAKGHAWWASSGAIGLTYKGITKSRFDVKVTGRKIG